jgi:hypothetical protein
MLYLRLVSQIRWFSGAKVSKSCARLALLLGFSLCSTGWSKPDLSLVDDAGGQNRKDRGHYFGSSLPDSDKQALIEYLKTL